jgi:hypothetical protein
MKSRRVAARFLAFAALLLVLPLAGAATTDLGTPGGSLKGQLLIAAPEMDDPRLPMPSSCWCGTTSAARSASSSTGRWGDLLRRPAESRRPDRLAVPGKLRIFAGGPVELNSGFVLRASSTRRRRKTSTAA